MGGGGHEDGALSLVVYTPGGDVLGSVDATPLLELVGAPGADAEAAPADCTEWNTQVMTASVVLVAAIFAVLGATCSRTLMRSLER